MGYCISATQTALIFSVRKRFYLNFTISLIKQSDTDIAGLKKPIYF